jgi:hypothetical protein
VQMPRLNGLAAAELIRALRPRTHIVLHSGDADPAMQNRAAMLGLQLLDKMHVEQIIQTLVHPDPTSDLPDRRIEAAVLSALTARQGTPVLILLPDGSVPFYNILAAELLGLPLPPRATNIGSVLDQYDVFRPEDHSAVPRDQRPVPVAQSRNQHEPVTEALIVSRDQTETLCKFTSVPFFDNNSAYVGAAIYIELITTLPHND